jgi:Rieske 2Fe-2S family protein
MQRPTETPRDFATARTLPGRVYWDADLYARELETIFFGTWLCAGHRSRLASPGEFFTLEIGPESILLTADGQGDLHAFYNVCRHRGSRVMLESCGQTRSLQCPYHAWTYGLDGRLTGAPAMDGVEGFDRARFPLRAVRVETLHGFLFVNLDEEAPPVARCLDDLPDLSRFGLADLERVARHGYEVNTNWKLICENYHECYHCALAHPQLHRISDYCVAPEGPQVGRQYVGGPMSIREGFNTMTEGGLTSRPPLPGTTEADRRLVHYFNVLPNLLLSIAPDYVLTHYLWPRGVDGVFIETEWFAAPEQMSDAGFDLADAVEFWDTTNRQDWRLCENALRGLRSRGHRPGPYQASEGCVHAFDRWYVQKMWP